jgi:uncharacterized protein with von Willebrand factor type A (vWA) domain
MSGRDAGASEPPRAPDGLAPARDLVEAMTRFVRLLRTRGLAVSPEESADAVRALHRIDLADRDETWLALRALLASRREDLAPFDAAFAEWWRVADSAPVREGRERGATERGPTSIAPPGAPHRTPTLLELRHWAESNADADGEPGSIPAPSTNESLGARDFATFAPDQLDAIERVARRMARRLTSRPSRRWKPERRGERVHLRGLLRQSLRTGGDVAELAWRSRRLRRTSLVALCDVSGSMDLYARFLLQFLFALQRSFARVESFVFATRLTRVTEQLDRASWREALERLSRDVRGWSGGTRIGESLETFAADHARLVDRRTVVLVLSDGWDTGDPAVLGEAMRAIHRRAGRVIWLNPLLAAPGYQPLVRGMQAALPHVDVFAPVHNLESLERLVRHLVL